MDLSEVWFEADQIGTAYFLAVIKKVKYTIKVIIKTEVPKKQISQYLTRQNKIRHKIDSFADKALEVITCTL